MKVDPKNIIAWVLMIVVPVIAALALSNLMNLLEPETLKQILRDHFPAVMGLPMAALLAAFIVIGLRHSEGPMKFEGLGMKFEGASGQVILWVVCFLAIASAIKLLW